MNIRLDHIQLVLFSPGVVVVNKLKTASALNDVLSGVLDGDPAIIPLPDDAPPEIPRIILKSKDEQYNLKTANSRIDFFFRYKKEQEKTPFPVPNLFGKLIEVFKYSKETMLTQFTRIAIVGSAPLVG